MIKCKENIEINTESNKDGEIKLYLSDLADFEERNQKLRLFSHAKLRVGEEVEYHIHEGESETYYILSGKGIYNDNGTEMLVEEGTLTFTPSGNGHGLKNIGDEDLSFIALILLD